MITPLLDRDTLDSAGLERLIEHHLAGGVHGLFVLGTSGEGPSLSYRLRRELVERTCAQVRGRVPVLVGISDSAFVESVALARHAAQAGAQALVTTPPFYFPEGQPELVDYVERLVRELPLPLFLYNMPQMAKIHYEPETIARLTALPGVVGVKDSSGDLAYFEKVVKVARQRPDWSVLVGPEQQLAATMRLGGDGAVCGGANVCPRLFVDWYEALRDGRTEAAAQAEARVMKLGGIYQIGRHASTVVKGMKCAVSLLGICQDVLAEPFTRFASPERQRVRAVLESLGLPVVSA